jgi:hypothetical protein
VRAARRRRLTKAPAIGAALQPQLTNTATFGKAKLMGKEGRNLEAGGQVGHDARKS